MYSPETMLDRFATAGLETASGPRIVVLCFDRLDRDLATALTTIEAGDHYGTNVALGHAQDLLGELAGALDLEAWEHAGALLSVYDYLLRRLAQANALKDVVHVLEAQRLITAIGNAFREAATTADLPVVGNPADGRNAPDDDTDRPRLSVQA